MAPGAAQTRTGASRARRRPPLAWCGKGDIAAAVRVGRIRPRRRHHEDVGEEGRGTAAPVQGEDGKEKDRDGVEPGRPPEDVGVS